MEETSMCPISHQQSPTANSTNKRRILINYSQLGLRNQINQLYHLSIHIQHHISIKHLAWHHFTFHNQSNHCLLTGCKIITIIMLLCRKIWFRAGRRGGNTHYNYEEEADLKFDYLKKYSRRYDSQQHFKHQEILFQEFPYGHSCHIAGTTPYNFSSMGFAKSVLDHVSPKLLLLGNTCDNQLRYFEGALGIRHFYDHPLLRPEKMVCKQRIGKYIQTRLQNDYCFNWDAQKKELIVINHQDKRIQAQDQLTIAHLCTSEPNIRIALGKPSDTLVLQDLILRYSVSDLRGILERAIEKVRQRRGKDTRWGLSYTREAIVHYVMSEEPEIYSKELTFQTALLRRYSKVTDKILMLLPGYFVPRVADQVHQLEITPQKVYRDGLTDPHSQLYGLLEKTMKENDPQTILEKFAILVMIRRSWIENEFAAGSNVFKAMLFGGLFGKMSQDELFERYSRARVEVEGKWYQLMQERVHNIYLQQGAHIKNSLPEQFRIIENRVTKDFPYTYQEKNYLSEHEDRLKMARLTHQMREQLNEEGDKHRIDIFNRFLEGTLSKEGIILFSKLLGCLNVELEDRLKLPVFHYGAFRGIYKQHLRDFLLRGEEDNKIEAKIQKRISKVEAAMQQHMKKLDDPIEIQKYITGKKGKALHTTFDPEEGPIFDFDNIDQIEEAFGEMSPQDEQEMRGQYKDRNPHQK